MHRSLFLELIKDYVSNEVEYDAGPIFRSYEWEPESLKMFISSTVESLNNLIPKVIDRNPLERQFKKHKRMWESFVSDLTKYYTSEEIKEESGFISKLKIIKSK